MSYYCGMYVQCRPMGLVPELKYK